MSDEAQTEEEPKTGLVFIDPDEKARHAAESLEEVLARSIVAFDASEFPPADSDEIAQAAAFVVCWDLGFKTGLELLEVIRSNEAIRDRKILISMDAPTRSRVLLAMELGADAVCRRPYDGEELSARLDQLGIPRPPPGE